MALFISSCLPWLTYKEIDHYRFDTDLLNLMDKDQLFGYADIAGKKTKTLTLEKSSNNMLSVEDIRSNYPAQLIH